MIEYVSRKTKALSAKERWKIQYPGEKEGPLLAMEQSLFALGDSPTPEEVNAALNDSWTHVDCDSCGGQVMRAVHIGQPFDWESATATVCATCLRVALEKIEEGRLAETE